MLDWIFPRLCELCREPCPRELCDACAKKLPRVPLPICLYCGAPVAGEQEDPYRCAVCAPRIRSFDFARSALAYSDAARRILHSFKYGHANYLSVALGEILNELWESTPALMAHEDWALVPVPIESGHLYARGYNQAEELARELKRLRGLRLISPLIRKRTLVKSQTCLCRSARWRNAMRAYAMNPAWAESNTPLPRHIVIVDDIYTTGATARSCARALRTLPGVEQIGIITLMRADS